MKSAVIYYSYSGNTRKVAKTLVEYLSQKGEAKEIELVALDESGNFFKQCLRARKYVRARIENKDFDLSSYDLVCLGTPVWAFGPAPAVNTYLDNCRGTSGKQAVIFTTYGSGLGNEHCLNYMQAALKEKGVTELKRFSIQDRKIEDRRSILSKIQEIV